MIHPEPNKLELHSAYRFLSDLKVIMYRSDTIALNRGSQLWERWIQSE